MLKGEEFSPTFDNLFPANIYIYIYIYIGNAGEERMLHFPYGGAPVSWYHNTHVWTFLKLMIMIVHMKMMQMVYLDIWSMLLSGQVPHRTNSSQLFWNGLFQKKNSTGERGVQNIPFWKKPWSVLVFLCTPGSFK